MAESSESLAADIRTPTGFAAAVGSMTPEHFAEAVSTLTEDERRKLSKVAQDLARGHRQTAREQLPAGLTGRRFAEMTSAGQMHQLALLAVGPRSAAVREMNLSLSIGFENRSGLVVQSFRQTRGPEQSAIRIILDRKPEWASEWLEKQLNAGSWATISWNSIRTLVKAGVCERPASRRYTQLFAFHGLTEDLLAQPDLLNDVWLLLQFETGAFDSSALKLATGQATSAASTNTGYEGWPGLMLRLINSRHLDRQRLHGEILGCLWKDWKSTTLADITRLHDFIGFSIDEEMSRFAEYLACLRNPVPTIVTWSIRTLKSFIDHPDFAAESVLESLPHVMSITSKAQPAAALNLAGSLVKGTPDRINSAAETLRCGLTHENVDIQETAVRLAESWSRELTTPRKTSKRKSKPTTESLAGVPDTSSRLVIAAQAVSDCLEQSIATISPMLRDQVTAVIRMLAEFASPVSPNRDCDSAIAAVEAPATANSMAAETSSGITEEDLQSFAADLKQRIRMLPSYFSSVMHLEDCVTMAERGHALPSFDLDTFPFVLPFDEPIEPVQNVEELLDLIGASLEHLTSPVDIDRIIDGISRFGMKYPQGFAERAAPIQNRLHARQNSPGDSLLRLFYRLPTFASLLSFWLSQGTRSTIDWVVPIARHRGRMRLDMVLSQRTDEVRRRLLKGEPTGPMLSLPTHSHGWIDPCEFLRRLREQAASDVPLCRLDFTTALLRVAPDHRDVALGEAGDLPERIRAVVRYALGADPEFTESNRNLVPEWLAAGRSRTPFSDLPELAELPIPHGPNMVQAGSITVRIERMNVSSENRWARNTHSNSEYLHVRPALANEEINSRFVSGALTELAFMQHEPQFDSFHDTWSGLFWPARPDLPLVRAIPLFMHRMDAASSSWDPIAPALRPLLQAERGWSDVALCAMCFALFSRDAEARAVAADALVEGILDGRAQPEQLARAIAEFASCSWAKLNRLSEALTSVSKVSSWASLVVATMLESFIVAWQGIPRDAHHVLSLLLEQLTILQKEPSPSVVKQLSSITGSGKSAVIAARLLRLKQSPGNVSFRHALMEGAQALVTRAERCVRNQAKPQQT